MTLYYSPSAGGFLDSAIHQPLPGDAVVVTAARHAALLAAQAEGSTIGPDAHGEPVARVLQPSAEEQLARLRAARDRLLAASDFTQLDDAPFDAAERGAWQAYRQALRDLPATFGGGGDVAWPTPPGKRGPAHEDFDRPV
ncbi:MAG TPA: tail fiber assembly protein [Sphingomonadaceae bacterium]|nr:tail fiber assembly protein [Sphingomonadaceae bacterium]